jgi:uncharacterized protein YecT (DUF1311 family)
MAGRAAVLLTVTMLAAGAARAEDWSKVKDEFSNEPGYAAGKAICARVINVRPPRSDLPTPAQAASLKGCDAENLYYGETAPADPVKARLCAFAQAGGDGESESDELFSGRTVLMMLYANGMGVRRNLDLAIHYACNIEGAPMEYDGRVTHLDALRSKGPEKEPFDFCNDITSGLAEGYCASRDQNLADPRRQRRIDALAQKAAPAAREAFAALRKAAYAFADARSGAEVDMSGTARAAMSIGAEEETRDQFVKVLDDFLAGRIPAGTPAQAKAADAALNAMWKRVGAHGERVQEGGTVTLAEVRGSQRAWLKYRDAFAAFAKAEGKPADGVVAALTAARSAQLKDLLPE